jgi:uncharacterized protein (DUF2141 family)
MKRIILPLLFAMTLPAWAGDLKLNIHGVGISGKTLFVAVHNSVKDFPIHDENAIKSTVIAQGELTELIIQNIPAGEYAVAVFADMNGNGKLDSNFIGIPKEPVGVSRDAKGKFGPPKFADAAFTLGDGITALTIELK